MKQSNKYLNNKLIPINKNKEDNTNNNNNLINKEFFLGAYNTLYDTGSEEPIKKSHIRYPEIISILKQKNFDIIGINECTLSLIDLIQNDSAFNDYYFTTDQVERIRTASKYRFYNVVLSKYYFEYIVIPLLKMNNLICLFQTKDNQYFIYICVHLVHHEELPEKRLEEMKIIFNYLENSKDVDIRLYNAYKNNNIIIAGDFNINWRYEIKDLIYNFNGYDVAYEFNDCKKESLFTWDCMKNLMAKDLNPTDDKCEVFMDHITINKDSELLTPLSFEIFADKEIEGNERLFPSDHFGICSKIKLNDKDKDNKDMYVVKHKVEDIDMKEDEERMKMFFDNKKEIEIKNMNEGY